MDSSEHPACTLLRAAMDLLKGAPEYADPGYQADGRRRFLIDTEAHIRAVWNGIHERRNADRYSASQLDTIKRRITAAWKREIDADGPPEHAGSGRQVQGAAEASDRLAKLRAEIAYQRGRLEVAEAMAAAEEDARDPGERRRAAVEEIGKMLRNSGAGRPMAPVMR